MRDLKNDSTYRNRHNGDLWWIIGVFGCRSIQKNNKNDEMKN